MLNTNKRKIDEIYDNKPLHIFCNLNSMKEIEEIENYSNKIFIDNDKKLQFENKYNISYELNYF